MILFFIIYFYCFFFLMIRRPPRSTLDRSSAASDVYKRQDINLAIDDAIAEGKIEVDKDKDKVKLLVDPEITFDSDLANKLLRTMQHYEAKELNITCLLYTSPSPRDRTRSRMPSSA